jgi:hypothetical protein
VLSVSWEALSEVPNSDRLNLSYLIAIYLIGNSRSQGIQRGTEQTGKGIDSEATVFIANETM